MNAPGPRLSGCHANPTSGRIFLYDSGMDALKRSIVLVFAVLAGCSPQNFFYYPNRTLYGDPGQMGIAHEIVQYPSLNGKMLTALYFPAVGADAKGTVV